MVGIDIDLHCVIPSDTKTVFAFHSQDNARRFTALLGKGIDEKIAYEATRDDIKLEEPDLKDVRGGYKTV